MQQAQLFELAGFSEAADHLEYLSAGQSELGRFTTRLFPATGSLRIELHPDAEHRHRTWLAGSGQHVFELVELFNHDHRPLACPCRQKCHFDELVVLKPVEHQQAAWRLRERQSRIELTFGTGLQAKPMTSTLTQVCLDHHPVLVDLHREHGSVSALVVEIRYRARKRFMQPANLAGDDLGESQQHRCLIAAPGQIGDDQLQVCSPRIILRGVHNQVALAIDAKVSSAPSLDTKTLGNFLNDASHCLLLRPDRSTCLSGAYHVTIGPPFQQGICPQLWQLLLRPFPAGRFLPTVCPRGRDLTGTTV